MLRYFTMVILCLSMSLIYSQSQSTFVHFDSDSHSLDATAKIQISDLLHELERHSDFQIEVIGHTDQDGSNDYNEHLARNRAKAVSEYLIGLGVSENKLLSQSKGERELLTEASTSKAKQKNRRVELKCSYSDYGSVEEMISEMEEEAPLQTYAVSNGNSELIDLANGGSIYVPKDAFVHMDGTPVAGDVKLEVIEAYSLTDFVAHDLYTESKGELLETGGMVYLNATVDGKEVELGENRSLEIIYPVSQVKEGMELFYMEDTDDGATTWVPADQPITTTQVKNNPVDIDLAPILNYDMGRVERPKAVFEAMPKRPRMEDKPFPPAESIYSEEKYKRLYANYEKNLADWKTQRPRYLAAEEAWQKVVNERLAMIRQYKDNLLEVEVKIKVLLAMKAVGKMESRRAPIEMLQMMFSFLKKQMLINIDERKIHTAALGNYTRDIISERSLVFNTEGYWMTPKDDFCRDLRLMIYDAMQLAREQRYAETGRMDETGFGSYMARVSGLGWINCDRFRRSGTMNTTTLTVAEVEKGTKHYLIYKNIASIIGGSNDGNVSIFREVQKGDPVKLVAVKLVDEKPYMAVRDFVTAEDETVVMDFYPAGLNDIKAELNQVDMARSTTLVQEEAGSLSLSIFPNPTTDAFTAEVSDKEDLAGLAIYDMRGAVVKTIDYATIDKSNPVSVSEFEDGTYVVTARFKDGRVSSEQLIVQNE